MKGGLTIKYKHHYYDKHHSDQENCIEDIEKNYAKDRPRRFRNFCMTHKIIQKSIDLNIYTKLQEPVQDKCQNFDIFDEKQISKPKKIGTQKRNIEFQEITESIRKLQLVDNEKQQDFFQKKQNLIDWNKKKNERRKVKEVENEEIENLNKKMQDCLTLTEKQLIKSWREDEMTD